jgi:putrescine transport system ATP-binding protein
MDMVFFQVASLAAGYGSEKVLHDVSFALAKGNTLAILGRSGCGKTTLLKTLAGLHPLSAGAISLNGENITAWKPRQRGILYLYQEALLFPHLNVFDNVAFGLRLRKVDASTVRTQTNALLEKLELSAFSGKMPDQLSGGQKQRVAFGRALNVQPPVLLLDEPFGSLDVETRANMQLFYKDLARQHQTSSVLVTHDLKEAVLLGDQFGFMEHGQLTLFPDLNAFKADARTGMANEMAFWQTMQQQADAQHAQSDRL